MPEETDLFNSNVTAYNKFRNKVLRGDIKVSEGVSDSMNELDHFIHSKDEAGFNKLFEELGALKAIRGTYA